MGTRKPEDIRSIALISHGGAGKTSLNEAFLYDAGLISRMGGSKTRTQSQTLIQRNRSAEFQ